MSTVNTPCSGSAALAAAGPLRAETPIADYALLSDCNSAALIDRDGTVEWVCLPRFDSPALLARILDPAAGHWSLSAAGTVDRERRYLPGTLVLETTLRTATGVVRLTDALAVPDGQRGHELGLGVPHEMLRLV
jgi:GH15 family glucan-1,4-alpha-glucosidase